MTIAISSPTPHEQLGSQFFDPVEAAEFPSLKLRYRNQRAAKTVGLEHLSDEQWLDHFGRFTPLENNIQKPLALRYHGHQFRNYNPDIGDGRGFLFAQVRDAQGRLLDLGTKGSGQTPYSRQGDGRLTLKGGVREILATEMLEAMGVNTSKTLSLIETGEQLERNDEPSPTRSSVMVRLNHSHIRFGTFQYLAYHGLHDEIDKLIDHCIEHYFPALKALEGEAKYIGFYGDVIRRAGETVSQWMASGFVHGVLNTDNMNFTGESFDYGPWRFMPDMQPGFTAAYFDDQSLYAYGRQPEAVGWNIAQLGGTLRHFVEEETLNIVLGTYAVSYEKAMASSFARRFGVKELNTEFIGKWLRWMNKVNAPFEQVIFDWYGGELSSSRVANSPIKHLYKEEGWNELQGVLCAAEPISNDLLKHSYFDQAAPCSMLIEEVEIIWDDIADHDDWARFETKLGAISEMREAYKITTNSTKE